MKDESFLSRWSRRKIEARDEPQRAPDAGPQAIPAQDAALPATSRAPAEESAPLPALDSLSSESDFAGFMQPEVDPGLRRQALKTLFGDARLYPMDGLDVYIDDYSKPDPLPEGWLEKLEQLQRLHSPRAAESGAQAAASPEETTAAVAPATDGAAAASDTSNVGDSFTESH